MIPYRSKITIIRNSNFKKHNTLLNTFLKLIGSNYRDLYYALNHDLNCITMNDRSEIMIIKLYMRNIQVLTLLMNHLRELVEQYYREKYFNEENNKLILKYII